MKSMNWVRLGLLVAAMGLVSSALAHNVKQGEMLPTVSIEKVGALVIDGKKVNGKPYSTASLPGRVRLIQAIAGRSSAKEINAPMIEAIKAAKLPKDRYQTVTIINVDDSAFGTGGFVRSKSKSSKKEFPHAEIVLDNKGLFHQALALTPKSSAIMLLDASGKVLFVKDGKLSDADVEAVMGMIQAELAK